MWSDWKMIATTTIQIRMALRKPVAAPWLKKCLRLNENPCRVVVSLRSEPPPFGASCPQSVRFRLEWKILGPQLDRTWGRIRLRLHGWRPPCNSNIAGDQASALWGILSRKYSKSYWFGSARGNLQVAKWLPIHLQMHGWRPACNFEGEPCTILACLDT